MRRTSLLVLLCTLFAPACSAVTDFGFTFSDGGGVDAGGVDSGQHDGGTDDAGPGDGSTDAGIDLSFDGGNPCPTTCDDGNPCNGVEICDTTMGACVTGTPPSCPPSDPCHEAGMCDPMSGGCIPGALISMDDGDPCNGVETCVVVGMTTSVTHSGDRCDDGLDCTRDTCDPATGGCTNAPNDASCGSATELCRVTAPPSCTMAACTRTSDCTSGDICFAGHCCMAAAGSCMMVTCTTDAMCNDGLACNGTETCDGTTNSCQSGMPLTCDDATACSVDRCVDTGAGTHMCTHTPGDGDSDGYLDRSCISGSGDDCNDSDATVHPLATDTCNGVDDNCNGTIDDVYATGPTRVGATCSDGLGVCMVSGMYVCAPSHTMTVCNVMAGTPSGIEVCGNSMDDDCDGMTDEGFMVGASCSVGVGACAHTGSLICSADGRSTVCNTGAGSPGNELCGNSMDDDCDGMIDEGFEMRGASCMVGLGICARTGNLNCSVDQLSLVCSAMAGPASTEVCNTMDDDCNGVIDDGPPLQWYRDIDGDGYGDSSMLMTSFCPPTGYTNRPGDCDDTHNNVNPGHMEVCGNMTDDDCNGLVDECPPANDFCTMARPLGMLNPTSGGSMTQTVAFATVESADCTAISGSHGVGPEVWYSFDVMPSRPPFLLYFDTFGSDYDTMISIRSACGTSPPIGCEDDTPCGPADSLRSRYAFVVPTTAPGSSHFLLAVHSFSAPGNMLVLNYQALPGATGIIAPLNTSSGATTSHALPGGSMSLVASNLCTATVNLATGGHSEDLYYVMGCPGAAHTLRVDTCLTSPVFNTVLYTRPGGLASSTDLACNDDDASCSGSGLSMVATSMSGAGIWGVYVDTGPASSPGTYTLRTVSY